MARAKKAAAPVVMVAAPAFFHPSTEDLTRAGFRANGAGSWSWFYDAPDIAGRWHIHLSLLTKSGEIFIFNTKAGNDRQYGNPGPLKTSVATREEFGALIKRYGWRHRK